MSNSNLTPFSSPDASRDPSRSSSAWLHRALFEKGLEAVLLIDAETRAIVDANKQAETLTGYGHDELLDLRLDDLHPRAGKEKIVRYFGKALASDGLSYDDLPLETKSSGNLPIEVKMGSLTVGSRTYVQVVLRDISKEIFLQREVLSQALKLTALNSLSTAIRARRPSRS